VVLLDDTDRTPAILDALRRQLSAEKTELELVPWYDRADFYNKTVTLFSRQVDVVWILIAVVMVLSISNTMIMSMLERTREIGTLLAMGFKRRRIRRQFLKEGAVLGGAGGLAGLIAALILGRIISTVGIPMPPPPGMAVGYTGEIMITWPLAVEALLLGLATSIIASLYPAWKASRMVIVDALRYQA
jgi:putative ABC transport system permease protein